MSQMRSRSCLVCDPIDVIFQRDSWTSTCGPGSHLEILSALKLPLQPHPPTHHILPCPTQAAFCWPYLAYLAFSLSAKLTSFCIFVRLRFQIFSPGSIPSPPSLSSSHSPMAAISVTPLCETTRQGEWSYLHWLFSLFPMWIAFWCLSRGI